MPKLNILHRAGSSLPVRSLLVLVVLWLTACSTPATSSEPTPFSEPNSIQASSVPSTPTAPAAPEVNTPVSPATESPAPDPAKASAQGVRLAVIGDYGLSGEPLARVAALVNSWEPDAILTTGDNNYPDGYAETIDENIGQYFSEYIGNYQGAYGPGATENRFFPALGNHDLNTAMGAPYFDYFTLPGNERYYDVRFGAVHVFFLNSDTREPDGVGRSSTQAAWLQQALSASDAPWKLVILHHPPYSSGIHGYTDYAQWPFEAWGASAVLSGHDHTYERVMMNGIPYFVNGLGGGPRYEFVDVVPGSEVRYRENYGAMLIEAEPARMLLRFINVDGEEIDRYSVGLPQASGGEASPLPQDTATASPQPALQTVGALPAPEAFQWTPYAQGLSSPVNLIPAPDQSGGLFVLEQAGTIRVIQDGQVLPEPFLDIRDRVGSQANEQGLLGLAFHPRFLENGQFFLNYTDRDGNTVIARFLVDDPVNTLQADPASEQRLLYILQPFGNHNGGQIEFGPDGFLYIGMGDGGSAGDPEDNAQNPQTLLGKLLRIDVDRGQPYAIPADNPYVDGVAGLPEIYLSGVRNPWKFSFDPANGDLYIADVGQNQWEEINYLAAGTATGADLGWDYREGPFPYEDEPPAGLQLVDPVAWYDHSQGCSVTGGVVVRGEVLPEFQGVYLYADYCTGRVWGLLKLADGSFQNAQLFQVQGQSVAFAAGPQGQVYLLDRGGFVYELVPR